MSTISARRATCAECGADVLMIAPWGRELAVDPDRRRWIYRGGTGDPRNIVFRSGIARGMREAGPEDRAVEGYAVHMHRGAA